MPASGFLRERIRRQRLARCRQVLEQADLTATEEQKQAAARALDCEDVLPDPQEELPMERTG